MLLTAKWWWIVVKGEIGSQELSLFHFICVLYFISILCVAVLQRCVFTSNNRHYKISFTNGRTKVLKSKPYLSMTHGTECRICVRFDHGKYKVFRIASIYLYFALFFRLFLSLVPYHSIIFILRLKRHVPFS